MWLAYDTETSFLRSGFKRSDAKILEIALYNANIKFQKLINPLTKYASGDDIINELYETGQHAENTLRFWTKLLIGKNALETSNRRKDTSGQASAISKLLLRSDIARTYKKPIKMLYALEKSNDDVEKAKEIKDRTMLKGNSLLFYTPKEAIEEAINTGKNLSWIAHNGKSFDEKILKGQGIDGLDDITFYDSLPLFRHLLKDQPSYSQPILYKSLFKSTYKAHHALDDSTALYKMVQHVIQDEDLKNMIESIPIKTKKYKTDLNDVKGFGPKSIECLMRNKIKTRKDLDTYIQTHTYTDWVNTFSGVHAYKVMGKKLFEV
jgi:DNA polymerase III epsilon subunit-like protein